MASTSNERYAELSLEYSNTLQKAIRESIARISAEARASGLSAQKQLLERQNDSLAQQNISMTQNIQSLIEQIKVLTGEKTVLIGELKRVGRFEITG